jgi:3-deoxy-manno-octulosonate cytidylyltransferase (CMP-KDO synthetase)
MITKSVIVIPARYGSMRLPGKPLALISGSSLLFRTWSIARSVNNVDEVYIATDDERIEQHALAFDAKVIMTKPCETGTDRVYDAITHLKIKPEVIINLQGDAVLTPPWVIQSLVDTMIASPEVELGTLATKMTPEQYQLIVNSKKNGEVGGTTVVFDLKQNALYFSKTIIPFMRAKSDAGAYRHIGLYGFRYATLEKYINLPQSPLELTEGLEQLRALENGIPIRIVVVDYQGRTHWAVDSQDDIIMVEKIISAEGELVVNQKVTA